MRVAGPGNVLFVEDFYLFEVSPILQASHQAEKALELCIIVRRWLSLPQPAPPQSINFVLPAPGPFLDSPSPPNFGLATPLSVNLMMEFLSWLQEKEYSWKGRSPLLSKVFGVFEILLF